MVLLIQSWSAKAHFTPVQDNMHRIKWFYSGGIYEWSIRIMVRSSCWWEKPRSNISPGGDGLWMFSLHYCDAWTKCALKSKDRPLILAAALDTKWDEKSIFNIFSGSAQAHSLSTNWIRLVVYVCLCIQSKSIFLMKYLYLFSCFGKTKRLNSLFLSPHRWLT